MTDQKIKPDMEARLRAIRDQAALDFVALKTALHNPYPSGSPEFNEYERSWTQALKRSDMDYASWVTSGWKPEVKPNPYVPPKVNEYAKRKG